MENNQRIDELTDKLEALEEETEEFQQKSFLEKFRNFAVTLMLLMISIGQWNDTKDVLLSAYEEVVSRWTNTLDYEKLAKLRVGYSSEYVENLLGLPQVTKVSKLSKNTIFSYYSTPKYILTTAVTNNRLSGFSVIALKNDFYAPIAYLDKNLNESPLASYIPSQEMFVTDFGNAEYFIESYELSRNLMFYDFSLGVINYGLLTESLRDEIKILNHQLNNGEDLLLSDLSIQDKILPNYYSVSEFSSEHMMESILSRYEIAALFEG
ncbi:ETEC_3214 domain-containing protein [Psychromonas sp.]|uniref:ETEC_3214 domain-containing protein n=1 Tax=Psychromonas sp. TaxID=1884585 RepID=UPI00356159B4